MIYCNNTHCVLAKKKKKKRSNNTHCFMSVLTLECQARTKETSHYLIFLLLCFCIVPYIIALVFIKKKKKGTVCM